MLFDIHIHSSEDAITSINQNQVLSLRESTPVGEAILSLVCKGIGKEGGEKAAIYTKEAFRSWFENEIQSEHQSKRSLERIKAQLSHLLTCINSELYTETKHGKSTAYVSVSALLLFEDGRYLLAHIGDTRIYQIRISGIVKLTQNHTFVEREVRIGNLLPEQAKNDPRRNLLLQCLGFSHTVTPDFLMGVAEKGDSFLLCSPDHFYENTEETITRETIALAYTESGGIEKIANHLFSPANNDFAMILVSSTPQGKQKITRQSEMTRQTNQPIYEGSEPYVFVSYSHKDIREKDEVTVFLQNGGVRFWFDDGLHSGDDWNYSIATHLKNAAVCLLLLSPNSASSDYVKNELNFALNHRIPIHTLLLQSFDIPVDIELMTGRIQIVEMIGNYGKKLLSALPVEVFSLGSGMLQQASSKYEHPLFIQKELFLNRQGTKSFLGNHRTLNYACTIQIDILKPGTEADAHSLALLSSSITHPVFPHIYDIVIQNGVCRTYQECGHEVFLDQYLSSASLSEEKIIEWIMNIVDGLDYLFQRNLGLRDFARGSLIVRNDIDIGIFRLQNVHYGLIQLEHKTKQYYFESEIQEISILLAQLCTGSTPILPLRFIHENRYRKNFLDVVNLVLQKCTREHGRTQYTNFAEIKSDLQKRRLGFAEKRFLYSRKKKLQRYDTASKLRNEAFAASNGMIASGQKATVHNLEKEFGFDDTVVLCEDHLSVDNTVNCNTASQIRILVCSTGQVFEFNRPTITIGRDPSRCELVWKQPYISRLHLRVSRKSANRYAIMDMNTSNGSYVSYIEGNKHCEKIQVPASIPIDVPVGSFIIIGQSRFQLK